jgi:DNA repair protein RadC
MFTIKEMPKESRPRERLSEYGPHVVQTHELIAIILRTGYKNISALDVAKELLFSFGSLKELANAPYQTYQAVSGIGFSKAIELKAAFELGRRSVQDVFPEKTTLSSPETIFRFLKSRYESKQQEHLIVLFLNTKGQLLKEEVLFIGSLNMSVVHPRDIFRQAVLHSAAQIIICHNHPSGDPLPSTHDIQVTHAVHESSLMMGIPLIDHIIIGKDRYYSFKEKGVI